MFVNFFTVMIKVTPISLLMFISCIQNMCYFAFYKQQKYVEFTRNETFL